MTLSPYEMKILVLDRGEGAVPAALPARKYALKQTISAEGWRISLREAGSQTEILSGRERLGDLDGKEAGVRVAPPYDFSVTGLLRPGRNRLKVLVANMLVHRLRDPLSMTLPMEPIRPDRACDAFLGGMNMYYETLKYYLDLFDNGEREFAYRAESIPEHAFHAADSCEIAVPVVQHHVCRLAVDADALVIHALHFTQALLRQQRPAVQLDVPQDLVQRPIHQQDHTRVSHEFPVFGAEHGSSAG